MLLTIFRIENQSIGSINNPNDKIPDIEQKFQIVLNNCKSCFIDETNTVNPDCDFLLESIVQLRNATIYLDCIDMLEIVTEDTVSLIFKCIQGSKDFQVKYEALWCLINISNGDRFGPLLFTEDHLNMLIDYLDYTEEKELDENSEHCLFYIAVLSLWVLTNISISLGKDVNIYLDIDKIISNFCKVFKINYEYGFTEEQEDTILWALNLFVKHINQKKNYSFLCPVAEWALDMIENGKQLQSCLKFLKKCSISECSEIINLIIQRQRTACSQNLIDYETSEITYCHSKLFQLSIDYNHELWKDSIVIFGSLFIDDNEESTVELLNLGAINVIESIIKQLSIDYDSVDSLPEMNYSFI